MEVETRHYDFFNDAKKCQYESEISKLDDSIRSIIRKEGYISCDITKKVKLADGGNYLGTLCEIDVKGITADGEKETSIFVKSMSSGCEVLELISIPDIYKIELFVYKELVKIYNELQDQAKIPLKERFNTVKCYDESHDTALIMENVTRKGFKTWYRMDVVSLSMAEECIKQLARFHAMSFVLEKKKPDYFAKKIKSIKVPHKFGEQWDRYLVKISKIGLQVIGEDLKSKIEKKLPLIFKNMEKYYTESDDSAKHCLCHGDYKPNNVLVKEVNGIVIEAIPVDFQIIFYGCPVLDLIYFIYMASDRKFRESNVTHLKNIYYGSLDDFLRHFDMSAESVLPRKTFENLYEEKLDFGLALSFFLLVYVFVSEDDDIPDVTKQDIMDIDFKVDDRYKDRLKDVVEEFIDLGYV